MGIKRPFDEALDSLKDDLETVYEELANALETNDINVMRVAISEVMQTVNTMMEDW